MCFLYFSFFFLFFLFYSIFPIFFSLFFFIYFLIFPSFSTGVVIEECWIMFIIPATLLLLLGWQKSQSFKMLLISMNKVKKKRDTNPTLPTNLTLPFLPSFSSFLIGNDHFGIPNCHYPSDHVAQVCEFEWVGRGGEWAYSKRKGRMRRE